MTALEAQSEIRKILEKVDCSIEEYDSIVKPIYDALNPLEPVNSNGYVTGDCLVPKDLDELPALSLSSTRFQAPRQIDNRDYCLKPLNQGQTPWCAAYAAKMFCEVIKWMERDYPDQNVISAESIYKYAKTIDGDPKGEGTTLTAVLKALLDKNIFDKSKCKIQVIRKTSNARELVKYAVHKFGVLPSAFNCTTEWYALNPNKTCITGKGNYSVCGGHAVLVDYYDAYGVGFCNSWSENFGLDGHGMISWNMFDQQFLYAACLTNVFDGLKMNI